MNQSIASGFYATTLESGSRRLLIMTIIAEAQTDGVFAIPLSTLQVAAGLGARSVRRVLKALSEDPRLMDLIQLEAAVPRPDGDHLMRGEINLGRLAGLSVAAPFSRQATEDLMRAIGQAGLFRAAASPGALVRASRIAASIAADYQRGRGHGL